MNSSGQLRGVLADMGKRLIGWCPSLTLSESHLPKVTEDWVFGFFYNYCSAGLMYNLATPIRSLMHSFQEWKRALSWNASPDLTSFFRLCDMKIFNMFKRVVPQSGPPYFVWQNSVLSVRCLFMNSLRQVSRFLNEGAKADRRAGSSSAWLWWACASEWSQVVLS